MRALLQADGTATACAALQQHSSDVRTTHLAALHILLAVSRTARRSGRGGGTRAATAEGEVAASDARPLVTAEARPASTKQATPLQDSAFRTDVESILAAAPPMTVARALPVVRRAIEQRRQLPRGSLLDEQAAIEREVRWSQDDASRRLAIEALLGPVPGPTSAQPHRPCALKPSRPPPNPVLRLDIRLCARRPTLRTHAQPCAPMPSLAIPFPNSGYSDEQKNICVFQNTIKGQTRFA